MRLSGTLNEGDAVFGGGQRFDACNRRGTSMLLMAMIVGSMHGINLMLITVVPKRFIKSGKVATYSGLLNACTYVGAAISSYGFAALAESFGRSVTILSRIVISVLGATVCVLTSPLWKKFRRDYAD